MTVRGWCPGVHEPMPSGDGLLVRVKPFGGRLTREALRALADAADQHGNGVIELTSRGNLQVRGLTTASAPAFAEAMVSAGLADPDPVRERRRNVITTPPYDDALSAMAEDVLANTPGLAPKFCVAIGPAASDVMVVDGHIDGVPCSPEVLSRAIAAAAAGHRRPVRPLATPPAGLLHAPFGQMDAAALRRLADRTALVRTTPFRAFYVVDPVSAGGFLTDAHAPLATMAACIGAPGCSSGTVATRKDAAWLAALGIGGLHVSGCAKGCARSHAGPTLVGRNGRYDLIRHGRAADQPDLANLTLQQAAELLA